MNAEERHEYTTFPSRKTTFTLFAEDMGDGWLQLLNLIMHCGTVKSTRKGERLTEVLNAIVTIKLAAEEELPACFDIGTEKLEVYYKRSFPISSVQGVRQLDRTIERLQGSHDTKRGTMVLLGPTDLDKMAKAPCVVLITFNIVDERLYGTYVLRSDDTYNMWPFDALSLTRLQREVSKQVGVAVDSATFISHSAHIYERDWGKARAKLDKWFKRPLPLQPDPSGLFFFGVENGRTRALFVDSEANTVLWEGESADPEDLVRYIVDTMPWLTAQHIRYLGQEAAKLTLALTQGVPYEQG